jgi:hypothetical protein
MSKAVQASIIVVAVANTVVVYAYNMWYPILPMYSVCTCIYTVYTCTVSIPNIPHQYSQHKRSGFPVGSCDTAAADGQRGSNAYEVNLWLWQFGRGRQSLGGLSVEKTGARNKAAQKERLLSGAETRRRHKADWA